MEGEYKVYLGDGVYADFDGFAVVLTTTAGIRNTNTVLLEPVVLKRFQEWIIELHKKLK